MGVEGGAFRLIRNQFSPRNFALAWNFSEPFIVAQGMSELRKQQWCYFNCQMQAVIEGEWAKAAILGHDVFVATRGNRPDAHEHFLICKNCHDRMLITLTGLGRTDLVTQFCR